MGKRNEINQFYQMFHWFLAGRVIDLRWKMMLILRELMTFSIAKICRSLIIRVFDITEQF
jgi:hypothetical protein